MNKFKSLICGLPFYLLIILFFNSLALKASPETARLIKKVATGMDSVQVVAIMGQPESSEKVERWYYSAHHQLVIQEHKIVDIRFGHLGYDSQPLIGKHKDQTENPFLLLRIGMDTLQAATIMGKAKEKATGEDWYYGKRQRLEFNQGQVSFVEDRYQYGLEKLDWIRLNFSKGALLIMNITLAFIMFGVALEINFDSFRQILKAPKSLVLGIFSQFLALPALTFILVYFLKPTPSVALGMILVAACPGGNISNFISSMAKGNVALSISLTAFATIVAVIMTPFNFAFWGNLYSETAHLVIPIRIDIPEMLRTVLILLGLPVMAGLWFSRRFPQITAKIINPVKKISMIIFIGFVIGALAGNLEYFKSYIHLIFLIVLAHNALALLTGFGLASLGKISRKDRRSLTIETGIQNSGLGLVLIFNPRLFDGLGGMAFIAAWWGIWHIISGLLMAYFWSKKPLTDEQVLPEPQRVQTH